MRLALTILAFSGVCNADTLVTRQVVSLAGHEFAKAAALFGFNSGPSSRVRLHIQEQVEKGRHYLSVQDWSGSTFWTGAINARQPLSDQFIDQVMAQVKARVTEQQLEQVLPTQTDLTGDGL